jgi:hypothetical protein
LDEASGCSGLVGDFGDGVFFGEPELQDAGVSLRALFGREPRPG